MKDINRSVSLYCPTCGNDQFETIDEYSGDLCDAGGELRFKCSDCGLVITKAELIEENQEAINANVQEIEKEILKQVENEIRKALK